MPTAEDYQAIRDLTGRYNIALDARDIKSIHAMFVDDVDMGVFGTGVEGTDAYYRHVMGTMGATWTVGGTHAITFQSESSATGVYYCLADEQSLDDPPHWFVEHLAMFDRYERHDGHWLFRDRDTRSWYVDSLNHPDRRPYVREIWDDRRRARRLPEAWPAWEQFWSGPIGCPHDDGALAVEACMTKPGTDTGVARDR